MSNSTNQNIFLLNLLQLPEHILKNSQTSGLVDLLLGHIASKQCFDLKKAAYILDNPEFNCTKGICGVEKKDVEEGFDNPWENPCEKIEFLSKCSFNQEIKKFSTDSIQKNHKELQSEAAILEFGKKKFNFEHPMFIEWTGRHGNHGLLFCEAQDNVSLSEKFDFLKKAAVLLGMAHH